MTQTTETILGFKVDSRSMDDCINEMSIWINKGHLCRWFACLNPHSYVVSLNDKNFSKALKDADWVVPDGIGIVIASRFLGGKIKKRITGHDIFSEIHRKLNQKKGAKVFFIGSTEETLKNIRARMGRDYPNIRVVGTYSPPYKPIYTAKELNTMIQAINIKKPDVLWVGMTAPKQEKWIYENKHRLKVKFAGAVGAVFDFYTGNVKRAHPVYRKLGLEWFIRLVREPRRVWRRTFISAPIFLWRLLLARFYNLKEKSSP